MNVKNTILTVALTPLALVAGDELASGPPALVVHGAAGVAQLAARVVPALARVLARAAHLENI